MPPPCLSPLQWTGPYLGSARYEQALVCRADANSPLRAAWLRSAPLHPGVFPAVGEWFSWVRCVWGSQRAGLCHRVTREPEWVTAALGEVSLCFLPLRRCFDSTLVLVWAKPMTLAITSTDGVGCWAGAEPCPKEWGGDGPFPHCWHCWQAGAVPALGGHHSSLLGRWTFFSPRSQDRFSWIGLWFKTLGPFFCYCML